MLILLHGVDFLRTRLPILLTYGTGIINGPVPVSNKSEKPKLAESADLAPGGEHTGLEDVGVHGGDDMVEQVRLGLEELLGAAPHHLLRLLRVLGRDTVPSL
jgi:hypothetical protein